MLSFRFFGLALLKQTAPPAPLVVASDGSGQFRSVQAAVDSVPENNNERRVILIKPGVYTEYVEVPKSKAFLTFRGTNAESTRLTFSLSARKLRPDGTPYGTSGSASVFVAADDFAAENITFENGAGRGKDVGQALALKITGDRASFTGCRFLGWQDTLYAGGGGRQLYRDCYIEGDVDFIFGEAAAVFEHCRIHSKGPGYVTAHARLAADVPTGYVFQACEFTGAPEAAGAVFLGRPWRPYSRVILVDCRLDAHIRPEGWDNWRNPQNEATAFYGEMRSVGPGADAARRVAWARTLSQAEAAPFALPVFFGRSDNWNGAPRMPLAAAALASSAPKGVAWEDALKQKPEWYKSAEAIRIADNLLLYQRSNGGWDKNVDMATPLTEAKKAALQNEKKTGDTTIDNGATWTQLRYLARVFTATKNERFRMAFLQGLDYLLAAQYPNGGWPQYYPLRPGYYSRITFNDGAMVGTLLLLRSIAQSEPDFFFVDAARRARAARAVDKGTECILRCQVVVGGKRTVWCAQHDEKTLAPARARAYEHPSLSGSESVGITRYLMAIEKPEARVREAIEGAMAWFERAKLSGLRYEKRVLSPDPAAPPLWARFYEVGTNRPLFSGRDGVIKYRLADIERERREGYAWYTMEPAKLPKEYADWKRKNRLGKL